MSLSPVLARRIIETLGSTGTPPEWGFQHFSAGIDGVLDVLEGDYLRDFLPAGGSSFKLLVGTYGGGKPHFLYSLRAIAWQRGFPVAYVPLSSDESPFHQLDRVYAAIVKRVALPPSTERPDVLSQPGLLPLLKSWHASIIEDLQARDVPSTELASAAFEVARAALSGLDSLQMQKALSKAIEALASGDDTTLEALLTWLSADGFSAAIHRPLGLLHGIDRSVALSMLRSLVQWLQAMGHPGLVILFDEAEQLPSLSTRQRDALLSNLRELIDECGHQHFGGVLMMYAVPDQRFFEGRSSVYEALNQRIATIFDVYNPTGVTIRLDDVVKEPLVLLQTIGEKLGVVFESAYGCKLENKSVAVGAVAKAAYEQRFGDVGYKRLFVQGCIKAFQAIRAGQATPLDLATARKLMAPSS